MNSNNKKNNKVTDEERDLFLHFFRDKNIEVHKKEYFQEKTTAKKRHFIDAKLDLHGLHPEDAVNLLYKFIEQEKCKGSKILLIIHGKGTGLLKSAAFSIAESHPDVDNYKQAIGKLGGDGALILKINQRKKK